MQTGGSIERFKREFEQCAPSVPPSTSPGGSADLVVPDSQADILVPDSHPEPAQKKRRRKGIRDPRLRLNDDTMAFVLPCLAKTSVRHLLLLSMVDRSLRDLVGGAHDLWKEIFVKWERRYYSRNSRSVAEEFAVRCLQAMPAWMAPHGQHRMELAVRGVRVWQLPLPRILPGSDWRDTGVPEDKKPAFDRFVRKTMALLHIGCCGLCGARQQGHCAVWSLGVRVCQPCWHGNVVSNRSLVQVCLVWLVWLVWLALLNH